MKEKHEIDAFFRKGVADYAQQPSKKVWENIENEYFTKHVVFRKWYYLGAAILLLLIIAGGIWIVKFDSNNVKERNGINGRERSTITSEEVLSQTPDVRIDAESIKNGNTEKLPLRANSENLNAKSSNKGEDISKAVKVNFTGQNSNLNVKKTGSGQTEIAVRNKPEMIHSLDPLLVSYFKNAEGGFIEPKKIEGLEEYLAHQRKSHIYTAVTASGGMLYYPSTADQFTWSAGIQFGLTAGKFYVETGVVYNDTRERGIYSIELKSLDSVGYYNQVESFEVDPSNPDQIIYNTKEVTVYDSIDHYTHTTPYFKYQYINLPLTIGFKFFTKERLTASVNTGVMVSLMAAKQIPSADFVDPDYTVVRIRNNTPERVDWNLLWHLGLRLNFRLTGSLSLSAEPVFTKYINSVYDINKGYNNVKPYSMSLRVGIFYGF